MVGPLLRIGWRRCPRRCVDSESQGQTRREAMSKPARELLMRLKDWWLERKPNSIFLNH